jgi:hypothetical protein
VADRKSRESFEAGFVIYHKAFTSVIDIPVTPKTSPRKRKPMEKGLNPTITFNQTLRHKGNKHIDIVKCSNYTSCKTSKKLSLFRRLLDE